VTPNGWQRLLIVLAAAWALGVISLAAAEHQARQGQPGEGFFTCRRPAGPPALKAALYWDRFCGLFPPSNGAAELDSLFAALPGGVAIAEERYLNLPRFLVVLAGPVILVGLCILAISWIVRGFRPPATSSSSSSIANAELKVQPWKLQRPVSAEVATGSCAHAWLKRLPLRWARNAAIGGGVLTALSTMPFLSKGDGAFSASMLVGFAVITLGITAAGYLCGLLARHSLKAPFVLSPTSAVNRIVSNWLNGTILIASFVFVSSGILGLRSVTLLFDENTSFRDWGYLTGFFGTWLIGGYVTALVSRRGLMKAMAADRKSAPALSRPPQTSGPERVPPKAQISIP